MTAQSTVARVLDTLGPTLLEPLNGAAGLEQGLSDVVIFDRADPPTAGAGDLVLGVGIEDQHEAVALMEHLADVGAVGLMIKISEETDALVAAGKRTGVVILRLARGASWVQVCEFVRTVINGDGAGADHGLAGVPGGDLFALANAIGALLDSPVTIEDRLSHVLAFSGRQDEADEGRVETILGRQVPERYLHMLEDRGVFRKLSSSREPIFIEPLADDIKPRVAIGVYAGDELLGSMWAAVARPLSEERTKAFAESARIAALHMLRLRVGADVGRRLQADLIATVLEGGDRAAAAAARLSMSEGPLRVIATRPLTASDDAGGETIMHRLRDAIAVHFTAMSALSATALIGGVIYTVLPQPVDHDDHGVRAAAMAEDLLNRIGDRFDAVIAVGPAALTFRDLAWSRQQADQVLRVLQAERGRSKRRVARLADVRFSSLLLRVSEALRTGDDFDYGSLAELRRYDLTHQAHLVDTLQTYLSLMGNVQVAADRLQIHPNTLRYRIRRAAEIGELDLDDPDERLAVTLLLRLGQFGELGSGRT